MAEGGGLEPPRPLRAVPVFETGSLANSVIPPVVRPAGFEPATSGSGGQRSNPLSYGRTSFA